MRSGLWDAVRGPRADLRPQGADAGRRGATRLPGAPLRDRRRQAAHPRPRSRSRRGASDVTTVFPRQGHYAADRRGTWPAIRHARSSPSTTFRRSAPARHEPCQLGSHAPGDPLTMNHQPERQGNCTTWGKASGSTTSVGKSLAERDADRPADRRVLGHRADVQPVHLREGDRRSGEFYDDADRRAAPARASSTEEDLFFSLAVRRPAAAPPTCSSPVLRGDRKASTAGSRWKSRRCIVDDTPEAPSRRRESLHATGRASKNLFIKIPGTPAGIPAIERIDLRWASRST